MFAKGKYIGEAGTTKKGKFIRKFITDDGNLVSVLADSADKLQGNDLVCRVRDTQLVFHAGA